MRRSPFPASSFNPPSVAPRYPAWVLLDRKAYFANVENATTATATSRTGHTVRVTFCLANPPSLSHFYVHGPTDHLAVEPQVVFSDKDLALLVFAFAGDSNMNRTVEYFVYKADDPPSLNPIPATPPGTKNTKYLSMVARDDREFFLADLCPTLPTASYDLSIFSSRTGKWITRTLQVQAPAEQLRFEDLFIVPHKAISLGGGIVGWVDLWRAVIVCDILAEDPSIHLIPVPKPEFNLPRKGDPRPIRDVTCDSNGLIRFVEMEHNFRREVVTIYNDPDNRFKVTKDLDTLDKMFDLDMLLLPHETFPEVPVEQITYVPDGWRIRTCYRSISWDHWRRGYNVHVDDILVNNRKHSTLSDGCGKSTLRNLSSAYPTLSPSADDVIYLMSKVDIGDKNAWMVGVDLGKRMVEIIEPYSAERASNFKLDCVTCAFSEFVNTTPRSCAEEAEFASNEAQKRLHHDHLSSGSSGWADRDAPSYRHSNSQHQPPLLSNAPQPLPLNLSSSILQAAGTAQASKEKTVDSQDQTGIFLDEKTKAAKRKASEMTEYTKESAVAGKDRTGSVLQQASHSPPAFEHT